MSDQQELVPQNEEEADAILNDISGTESEIDEISDKKEHESAQAPIDIAFTVGGKEIKLDLAKDRDKLIRWAQQGYEAPNKISELNKALEGYKTKETQFQDWQKRYGPVDEYVRQNPQWWDYVQQQYEQLQQARQEDPNSPIVQALAQRLEKLEGVATTYQQQEMQRQAIREDQVLNEEIQSIQKQYPKIDFSTPGPDGKSLEYKVLEFAQAKGIREFTTAFKAFHHDELVKLAAEEAKEKLISDKQSRSKLGILGISSTPKRAISDSVKGKTYDDLYKETLSELGLS